MKLQIEIKLVCDSDETLLAVESEHVTELTDTQRAIAKNIARSAVDILAGKKVVTKPLIEHLAVD